MGGPSLRLTLRTTEKDPRQGNPLNARTGGSTEKDWPERSSNPQLQEARKKDSDRVITPATEPVCVPAHSSPPGSPQAKKQHHLHAQLSLGKSCHRQKKKKRSLVFMHAESLQSCLTLCNPVDYGLPGFPVREGVPQARILGHIGQYWLP